MPSSSPSPMKRPSLTERASSTHSLSSSGKHTTSHKVHRPHVVNRHSRNVSHGKGLSKLGKVQSTASITSDTQQHHTHQRKKSGGTTPPQSPGASLVRRNTSHAALPKNHSHGNLRKNHSANALARNLSHPALKKVGLAPAPKSKNKDRRDNVFQIGDHSSEDEEEGEWEDSTTQSPEATRNNSKTSTPAGVGTPNGETIYHGLSQTKTSRTSHTSSPPEPSLKTSNLSAPNLRKSSNVSPSQLPQEPHLLQQKVRASRAPPAMSTISAHVGPAQLGRTDSTKSLSRVTNADAAPLGATPGTSVVGTSSSIDGGVSHFLETPNSSQRIVDEGSDAGSPSGFLSNYKPQPSESPEKPKMFQKPRGPQPPSRTQQKLELQRREIMRGGGSAPTTPPASGIGLDLGSSTSLHSRAGSRNRNRNLAAGRTLAGDFKAVKQDYEAAVKQLTVVRRFRSPIVESMTRIKDVGGLPQDIGMVAGVGAFSKSRPQSRRGYNGSSANGHAKSGVSRSFEDRKPSPLASRSSSRGGGRVHFQRQTSHDDIEVTPSQGSLDELHDDEQDGLSPEEALLRRIWDSRELYDSGELGGTH